MKRALALFDLDGTLADDRHRQHLAMADDWTNYFAYEAMVLDEIWAQGRDLFEQAVAAGTEIGYLTGRREDTRPGTEAWLAANGFPFQQGTSVRMKPKLMPGQDREQLRTAVFKAELIQKLAEEGWAVTLYDDDPEVCAVVNDRCGDGTAVHCTWHIKPEKLVRRAEA
jgi:FMN phosphatase YigB (HAD superfamily)